MKKTDYLALNLWELDDELDIEKAFNDNPKLIDKKIKSLDETDTAIKADINALKTAPSILVPTLYNGWVVSSPTLWPLKYWKDPDGIVHFRLAVKNGATGTDNAVTIFPTGYRPAADEPVIGHVDNGGTYENALFTVKTNGNLQTARTLPANGLVIINGEFRAV